MTESWSSNANATTSLRLAGPSHLPAFHPEFTYPIFGEAETIYGYQGLDIKLHFAAGSLVPLLKVEYKAKNEGTTAKIDDVEATLKEYLPSDYVSGDEDAFQRAVEQDGSEFRPFGEKVHSYTRRKASDKGKGKGKGKAGLATSLPDPSDPDARVFEIYRSTWETPGFQAYHRRMQIFALLFIEGASYIQEDEANWEFFCLYEKLSEGGWQFMGYTSLYKFWCWPDAARMRLSQFVVLPPFQKQGHGGALYSTVHTSMLQRESVMEMTVEDPSEAFDRLRDSNDLRRLLAPGGFVETAKAKGMLAPPIDRDFSETQRLAHKIAPRQWSRLVEMIQLLSLEPQHLRAYRLQVKARLFRFNKDILVQLPKEERIAKLKETFEGVIDEYGELVGVDVEPFLDDEEEQHPGKRVRLA